MKKAVLLHGGSNNSQGNWLPWLKGELEKRGYQVWSPDLPESDHPNWQKWLEFILKNKPWEFDEETILIGHSAGATEILRILESLPEGVKVDRAILVAGYVTKGKVMTALQYKDQMVQDPFNFAEIKKHAKGFYFICSDNDAYSCGIEETLIMRQNLGGEVIFKSGEGHFNLEKSPEYKQFPLLLTLID